MLRKWGTAVLLFVAMPALAWAQNTGKLAGVVTDASTGDPLPGANVVLEGTQMGTITDADGNYFILGVPVGTYDIQASFVGYQGQTVTDVEITSGLTRELNFSLSPGLELEEIVVQYERPIIQRDAVGASRVVTAEDIQNLPVRGVAGLAQLQGGVVGEETSGDLYIRGGREEEVQYYIDGVKAIGLVGVPQSAIQEQEMLIGTIPARYGDAMSGIISITTKSGVGSRFFGSLEGITSEALDGYGYNLGSLSLGGPILGNKLSFFVSGEYEGSSDMTPFAVKTPVLSDEMFADIRNRPQVLAYGFRSLPMPSNSDLPSQSTPRKSMQSSRSRDSSAATRASLSLVTPSSTALRRSRPTTSSVVRPSMSRRSTGGSPVT